MVAINYSSQRGFILAATLWVLAIMFVVVGIFHGYVQQKLSVGVQAKANMQRQLDQQSTKQTLLYLLSTSRMTRAGLTFAQQADSEFRSDEGLVDTRPIGDEMLLDGTTYYGLGDVRFALQDLTGLVPINAPNPTELMSILEKHEPDPVTRTQLISRLQDYIDANEMVSLSGAEAQDYIRASLPLPTNDFLRSEDELLNVMGWQEWLLQHPSINWQSWFSASRNFSINLNTIPRFLLIESFGLSEELASQLAIERSTNTFISVDDFALRAGLGNSLNELKYRFFPSNELRVSLWNNGGGQAQVISLQLTPNGLYGPWLVNYEYSVQRGNDNNEPLAIRQTTLFGHTLGDDR